MSLIRTCGIGSDPLCCEGFLPPSTGPKPNNKAHKHDKAPHPNENVTQHNDKCNKNKGSKIYIHCNFFDHDGQTKSKCFKNMEDLEVKMKRQNIQLDTYLASSLRQANSSSSYAPSRLGYPLNGSSSSSYFDEWLIDFGASYHMRKDKAVFSTLNDCNTKNIFFGDDRYLSVEGSGIVHLNNGQFKDVLCVCNLFYNLLLVYQINNLGEGKSVFFTPHQVVIWDLKYPQHIVVAKSVDDITRFYKFDKFWSSSLPSIFVAHSDEVSMLWHE